MYRGIRFIFFISFILLISGCSGKVADIQDESIRYSDEYKEEIEYFLSNSREMSEKILSNETFDDLENYLESKKETIDDDLYGNYFKIADDFNKIYFSFDYVIDKKDIHRVFADDIQDMEKIKIIIMSNLYVSVMDERYKTGEEDGHLNHFHTIVTEVFEYDKESKKLVGYDRYE